MPLDGVERPITLVPPHAAAPRPVVVALHRAGHGTTPHDATTFGSELVGDALDELDAVIAALDCPGETRTDDLSQRVVLAAIHRLRRRRSARPVFGCHQDAVRKGVLGSSEHPPARRRSGTRTSATHADRFRALLPIADRPLDGVVNKLELPTYAISGAADAPAPPDAIVALSARMPVV